jgi:hypothetical protein
LTPGVFNHLDEKEKEQAAKVATMEKELDIIKIMGTGGAATMMEDKRKFEQVGAAQGGRRKKKRKLNILESWGKKTDDVVMEDSVDNTDQGRDEEGVRND